mmetsp:Transcript_8383/g.10314  ORF Transcript_8383/g.10314 Transcript_8383/m.10314 type:complete len:89 (+) Transcript_8383:227-493(+)
MKPSINKVTFVEDTIYDEEDIGATNGDDNSSDYDAIAEQNDAQDTQCLLNPTAKNYFDDNNLYPNECSDNDNDMKHINWVEDSQIADY